VLGRMPSPRSNLERWSGVIWSQSWLACAELPFLRALKYFCCGGVRLNGQHPQNVIAQATTGATTMNLLTLQIHAI
jgi:hypothetical protein